MYERARVDEMPVVPEVHVDRPRLLQGDHGGVHDQDRRDQRCRDRGSERYGGSHRPADVEHIELEPEYVCERHGLRAHDLHEEPDRQPYRDEADTDGQPSPKAPGEALAESEP